MTASLAALATILAAANALFMRPFSWRHDIGFEIGVDDVGRQKVLELITSEITDEPTEPVQWITDADLLVRTNLAGHLRVRRLLEQLRAAARVMVTVTTTTLNGNANFLEEIGIDAAAVPGSVVSATPEGTPGDQPASQ